MSGVITIAGDVGSGKSTVGKLIAQRLGLPYLSTGVLQREIARSRGVTTLELNRQSMADRAVDDTIDNRLRALDQSQDPCVVDARLGWFFIPSAFKVFLSVDPREGARRTFAAQRPEEDSREECAAMQENMTRRGLENARFLTLYGADCASLRNYDLVIDTTHVAPDAVAEALLARYPARADGQGTQGAGAPCLISPKRLLPTCRLGVPQDGEAGDGEERVRVLATEWFFILLAGHRRVSEALKRGEALITCEAQSPGSDKTLPDFLREHLQRTWIEAWEGAHGFRFLSYPDADLRVVTET